jgi:dihydrofolate reductase
MITFVAALSHGRVMGLRGGLPWGHGTMKTDQQRFRDLARDKPIVIGSRTFDPEDDYVKNASHVYVFTHDKPPNSDHITAITSVDPILELSRKQEVIVVGGANVFEQLLPYADKLELTYIDADYEGDRYFPEIDEADWRVVHEESHAVDRNNRHPYRFVTLERK